MFTPINIFLGRMTYNEILFSIIKLGIWAIILYAIAKIFFNHAVKKVTINGG
ncbi:MAG: ABC-2 family transporter protein [Clostridia bacterium]|nr:ABC-2 family transporter protein [Clostridia bacterium]